MNLSARKSIQVSKHKNVFIIPALMEYTKNYIYYVLDEESQISFLIDPGEANPVIHFLEALNPKFPHPKFILNTHHHWDHVNGNLELKKKYGCKIVAAKSDWLRIPGVDIALDYNQVFSVGSYNFQIIHTPGHTKNHIAFYDSQKKQIFCGDTIFSAGCGGIFEGTLEEMFLSFEKFFALPNETEVFTAHEYTIGNLKFSSYLEPENEFIKKYMLATIEKIKNGFPSVPSTMENEKIINPFLKFNSKSLRKNLGMAENFSNLEVFRKIMKQKENYYN